MRDSFSGYYRPTGDEFDELWNTALLVPDANVLLNFHRLSSTARASMFAVFGAFAGRVWAPHQAALEYQRRRLDVVNDQRAVFDALLQNLDTFVKSMQSTSASQRYHAILDKDELLETVREATASVREEINLQKKEYEDSLSSDEDPIRERVAEILSGVGPPYDDARLTELHEVAANRYEREIPPGYADRKEKRDAPDRLYGDFVLWRQVLDHATEQQRNVLFVTDDRKDDWWWISKGRTIGPRPELRQEFHETTRQLYYQYTPSQLLEEAKKRGIGHDTSEETIREVRDLPSSASVSAIPGVTAYTSGVAELYSNALRPGYYVPAVTHLTYEGDPVDLYNFVQSTQANFELRPGFVAQQRIDRQTGIIHLVLLTQKGAVGNLSPDTKTITCQVVDPTGRRFQRSVEVGTFLPLEVAAWAWPLDFTSGEIATGSHDVLWFGDVDARGEQRLLAGGQFDYPFL